jgi:hypothetical protein
MARIQGVPQDRAGPIIKLVYRLMRRRTKKMTGREAVRGSGIEPVDVWAGGPKMMSGMGKFQQVVRKGNAVDERLRYLVELKGAQLNRLRVLRRPRFADLPELGLLRRGAACAAARR